MYDSVSKTQIEDARNASLADYFQSNGYEIKKHGNEIYIKEFPGLCVNIRTNNWYNHYESYGGKNAIDCLTKVVNLDFKTAVSELSGKEFAPNYKPNYHQNFQKNYAQTFEKEKPKKEFSLPEAGEKMNRVFAYLNQTRRVPAEIISEMVKQKLLYQDKKGNAVFVHRNEKGEAIGAEIQGTCTFQRFKGIAAGTGESVFSFQISKENVSKAYVFESAIDLLSFYCFCKKDKIQDAVFISMAGLKPYALQKFLNDFNLKNAKIFACVDNDDKGKKFCEDNNFVHLKSKLITENVKDYNELLQKFVQISEQKINAPELNNEIITQQNLTRTR